MFPNFKHVQVVRSFEKDLFLPYVQSQRGVSGGRPLHLADIIGGASDLKVDLLESVYKLLRF